MAIIGVAAACSCASELIKLAKAEAASHAYGRRGYGEAYEEKMARFNRRSAVAASSWPRISALPHARRHGARRSAAILYCA